jgi:3-hydroxy-3-methylglutaryl CoA synthase
MTGIKSFGAYIPAFRLSRDIIAKSWGRGSIGGERSVANNDEDPATMAVEATFDCLKGIDRKEIDGLFFCSTTSPYREKQIASLVATVVDLDKEIMTVDFANSLRSGTNAMVLAYNSVKAGSARGIIVSASDCRLGYPRSDSEQSFGDGAGAILFGNTNVIATVEATYSITNEMMDVWRNPQDTFVRSWESRWILGEGYLAMMRRGVTGLMKKCNIQPKDIQNAVLPAPDIRTHRSLASALGFDLKSQVEDPLISTIGDCGTAQPLIMLSSALEKANPGDRILLAAYGDGVDVFLFKVTDEIKRLARRRGVSVNISSKLPLPSYERYLSYRGLVETVPGEPFRLLPSATAYWRDMDSILRCYGSRCLNCGTLTYPIQRVCYTCRSKDNYEKVRLSDKKGKVFTFSLDNLAGRSDDPVVVQTVIEMDEGNARFYCMMTDCIPAEVRVGMPVELTFRRLYEGAGFHNYFWKCRPIRDGGK